MNKYLLIILLLIWTCIIFGSEAVARVHSERHIYNPYPDVELPSDYCPAILHDMEGFKGGRFPYQMWHEGPNGIAISGSQNGSDWQFLGETALQGVHPCVVYDAQGFGGSGYFYKMWVWNGQGGITPDVILFSQSIDGLHWQPLQPITQDECNPIVFGQAGSPFANLYGPGLILYNSNATSIEGQPYTFPYVMFYDAVNGSPTLSLEAIGMAVSEDGVHWKRYADEPILTPSALSEWDGTNVFKPAIWRIEGTWHMLYSGSNELRGVGTTVSYGHGIGHAYSADGVLWTKDGQNPWMYYADGVEWRSGRSYRPTVIPQDERLGVWFVGGKGGIAGQNQSIGFGLLNRGAKDN